MAPSRRLGRAQRAQRAMFIIFYVGHAALCPTYALFVLNLSKDMRINTLCGLPSIHNSTSLPGALV
jgi:hypothetical protein